MRFDARALPDLDGKTIVITGGNSGVGLEAARYFAAHRARVVLACRDAAKMDAAAASLRRSAPGATVDQVVLDLASLASIRAAALELAARAPRIDVLVNNAGVMAVPERETEDGFELQFVTNHLGHFALTGLVLPLVADGGRVVTVASLVHHRGHIVFEDIPKPARYDEGRQYAMSKLANVLFAVELDRRLKAAGRTIRSIAAHPGYSATNLQLVGPRMKGARLLGAVMRFANAVIAQRPEIGALGTVYAAVGEDLVGGEYVGSNGWLELRGLPEKCSASAEARDPVVARRLWELSEKLTGVHFSV
jgi:NAD(P)-dependent dehydrogenase (short-subunit alcohol dehydrogenase family)